MKILISRSPRLSTALCPLVHSDYFADKPKKIKSRQTLLQEHDMRIKSALVSGALGLASLAANAADISLAGIPTSQFAIDGNAQTFNYTSSVADSAATFSFVLQGYNTVDGYGNGYDDLFRVSVNGAEVEFGFFNLGGGGINLAFAGSSAPV